VIPILAAAVVSVAQQPADRWAPVAEVIEAAIADRAFPGAVLAVGRRDTVLLLRAFGTMGYRGQGAQTHRRTDAQVEAAVETTTVYDLASLTKVVGLTTAIMMVVDEARLDLDAPVGRYLTAFGRAHGEAITVRHLLTHSSGLPAWKPYWQTARSRREVFALAAREPLEYPTGTRVLYSDVGAIVLTEVVERLTGERLDRWLRRRLFEPLGMASTRFLPPRSWLPRIAPTEVDTTWRRRLVHGTVHDENAHAMSGVSGHAGLFGTAGDLVRFAQMMLRGCRIEGSGDRGIGSGQLVRPATIAEFTRVQNPALSHRALGWETPNGENSAGTRLSARAYGHTGFTGTMLWIDPAQDLFVVLLTNRVHPTRDNTRIFAVRRQVMDAVVAAAREPD
jgi:CubicO group peptidase (beta-lactamase class C family)